MGELAGCVPEPEWAAKIFEVYGHHYMYNGEGREDDHEGAGGGLVGCVVRNMGTYGELPTMPVI